MSVDPIRNLNLCVGYNRFLHPEDLPDSLCIDGQYINIPTPEQVNCAPFPLALPAAGETAFLLAGALQKLVCKRQSNRRLPFYWSYCYSSFLTLQRPSLSL